MKITKNNYEIWFIDYFDGNLSNNDTEELMHFLENNPGLKNEFEEFENIQLVDKTIRSFPNKEILKKQDIITYGEINTENYTDYFIAFHEKDLTSEQVINLEIFLAENPYLKSEFNTFKLLKSTPDSSVFYPDKKDLKKYPFVFLRKPAFYLLSAAASVVILLGVYLLIKNNDPIRNHPLIASIDKRTINTVTPGESISKETTLLSKNSVTYKTLAQIEPTKEERNELIYPVTNILANRENEVLALNIETHLMDFLLPRQTNFNINFNDRDNSGLLYAENTQAKERTFLGKLINNSFTSIKSFFSKSIPDINLNPDKNNRVWNMAKAGIDGYNFFTDNDLELVAAVDEKGEIVGYALLGNNIQYLKRTKK